jgi:hypothetical protein
MPAEREFRKDQDLLDRTAELPHGINGALT